MKMKNDVKHPCVNCVYFKTCGNTNRTMPCDGRQTKTERNKRNEK